jgi:archaellum component FlaC
MDIETAKKLVESSVVQKYIENIDSDAQAALDVADSNLSGMGAYPSGSVAAYRARRAALDKAWGQFNAAWNLVVFGKAKDGKAAMLAYRDYVVTLTALEADNVMWSAYLEARFAEFASAFIAFLIQLLKNIGKAFEELEAELKELKKLLEKARKEVKEAEAQRVIDVAITVVSLCIPAVGLGAGLAIAAGTFTLQMVVDASLGPGKPGVLGTVNNAAGDTIGLVPKIKTPFAKFGGALSGIVTLKLDSDEVDDAKKIVAKVRERMKTIDKTMDRLLPFVSDGATKLATLQKAFEKSLEVAQSKAKAYRSAEAQRLGLLKELNALND